MDLVAIQMGLTVVLLIAHIWYGIGCPVLVRREYWMFGSLYRSGRLPRGRVTRR
jgi:hypothetical protein